MRGESRHGLLAAGGVKSVRPASLAGELFDMGEHPGMKLSAHTHGRVTGELIEFDSLDTIMEELDREEGAGFRREIVNVAVEGGGNHFAWTYVLAGETGGVPVIASGNWRKR